MGAHCLTVAEVKCCLLQTGCGILSAQWRFRKGVFAITSRMPEIWCSFRVGNQVGRFPSNLFGPNRLVILTPACRPEESLPHGLIADRHLLMQHRHNALVIEIAADGGVNHKGIGLRPGKCRKTYRMVVVRKNISTMKGDLCLVDELRYFFYITSRRDIGAAEVVRLANARCDQENVIAQLKSGVGAMRVPVYDLVSNWAYMVMAERTAFQTGFG